MAWPHPLGRSISKEEVGEMMEEEGVASGGDGFGKLDFAAFENLMNSMYRVDAVPERALTRDRTHSKFSVASSGRGSARAAA